MNTEPDIYVFVYGTLKRGHRNHESYLNINGVEFIGLAQTNQATFLMQAFESVSSPGKFTPGVFEGGAGYIHGEVYKVSPAVLAHLDELEGVGLKYDRKEIPLSSGMRAFIYLERPGNRTPLSFCANLKIENNVYNWV